MNHKPSFFLCRKDPLPLLASAVMVCLAAVRAAGADWSVLNPALADSADFGQPQAVSPGPFVDAPGTPNSFTNPGGETIIIVYNSHSARPAPVSTIFDIANVVAGDIVMLRDPAGTNDPSNWTAVFRFLSLDDPTGSNGLPANRVEGFDTTNTGPEGFTGFHLFPNTIYLADAPTSPADHVATAAEFGPDRGIQSGQLALFVYHVSITDVPEPATWLAVLAGIGIIAGVLRRRPSTAKRIAARAR